LTRIAALLRIALGGIADYRESGEVDGNGIGAFVVFGDFVFAIPTTRHWVFRGGATAGGVGRRGLPPLSAGKYVAILPFRVWAERIR